MQSWPGCASDICQLSRLLKRESLESSAAALDVCLVYPILSETEDTATLNTHTV